MNEWPCMEAELELQVATTRLVEASDALKFLHILPCGATLEERLHWQDELANIKSLINGAQETFKEKSDALLKCKEQFAGRV